MTNGDDTQYAGSDQPQTADEQKKSDQQLLDQTPAPRAELVKPPAAQPTPESDSGALPSVADMYKFGLKNYLDAEAQIEKNNARLQPLQDRINQYLAQPLPQAPQLQQVPAPPSQQQIDQRLNQGRFSYLAIALPLALLLGRRGKNAAWYAMGAFGQGLDQLQKNNMQGARDMFSTWQEAAKYAQEENSQRLEQYKLILENRNLTLNQQSTLIENLSHQFNDPYVHKAAVAKDMIGIANELAKAESQGNKFQQETDKLSVQSLEAMGRNAEAQVYRKKVQAAGGPDPYDWRDSQKRHNGDMYGNFRESEKYVPYEKFNKDYWAGMKQPSPIDTEGTSADQEYINQNKKLGIQETPVMKADGSNYKDIPQGAYYKIDGDDAWYLKK